MGDKYAGSTTKKAANLAMLERLTHPALGAAVGAAGGGTAAYRHTKNEKDKTRNAIIGALIGGASGGAAGMLSRKFAPVDTLLLERGKGLPKALEAGYAATEPLASGGIGTVMGSLASKLPESRTKEFSMQGHKYAGVTLDWYDDNGETLKQKFPTLDKVPDIIKEASVQTKDKVPNEDFALIMIDGGYVFRKYACADPGTTAMSVIYFMEHGDKLPEEAQKTAATNLVSACLIHDILPPAELTKMALNPKELLSLLGSKIRGGAEYLRDLPGHLVGKNVAAAGSDAISGGGKALRDQIPALTDALKEDAVRQGTALVKQLAPGMVAGGAAGALGGATHDDALLGAGRGIVGGALGGLAGRAAGPGILRSALGGSVVGGAGGTFFGKRPEESKKKAAAFGGWFMPGASSEEKQRVALEYARKQRAKGVKGYELVDEGDVPKTKGKKPEESKKTAAVTQALPSIMSKLPKSRAFGRIAGTLAGGAALGTGGYLLARHLSKTHAQDVAEAMKAKAAGGKNLRMLSSDEEAQKVSSVVDVTGKRPTPRIKVAAPTKDEDYAVIMPDGSRHYPIHTWDMVKKAEDYFLENRIRFQPDIRRQFAVKLASKAKAMGYPVAQEIASLGSRTYTRDDELRDALDMRKVACSPKNGSREILDDLFEKRASIHPEVFAECLKRFDISEGLDKGWDKIVPDPWSSTFGIKTASYDVIWEEGADRVTRDALEDLAENHLHLVTQNFTYDVAKEFKKDPIGIFESMPLTHKKILARLASDAEADGTSEKGTNRPAFQGA